MERKDYITHVNSKERKNMVAKFNVGFSGRSVEVEVANEKEKQILQWCADLSMSQGSYMRMFDYLVGNQDALAYLAEQGFKDAVEFVMFVEG